VPFIRALVHYLTLLSAQDAFTKLGTFLVEWRWNGLLIASLMCVPVLDGGSVAHKWRHTILE